MDPAQRIQAVKRFLRRTKSLSELETLAETTFASASQPVTLTTLGFEGGQGSGVLTMEPSELLSALEEIILEKQAAAGADTPLSERSFAYARQRPYPAFRATDTLR